MNSQNNEDTNVGQQFNKKNGRKFIDRIMHRSVLERLSTVEARFEPYSEDADGSVTPTAKALTEGRSQLQTLTKIDLGACYFFVPLNRLLHRQYVQSAGHKDSDIIGIRRDLRSNTAGKGDSIQSQISLFIPKPIEQRLESKDTEKRR